MNIRVFRWKGSAELTLRVLSLEILNPVATLLSWEHHSQYLLFCRQIFHPWIAETGQVFWIYKRLSVAKRTENDGWGERSDLQNLLASSEL